MFIKWQALRKNSKGFTLIELMIVVAIIAILAAIAIPQYKKFQLKAKTSEAKANLGAIRTAEEAYSAETDNYVFCGWTPSNAPTSGGQAWVGGAGHQGFISIGFQPAGTPRYVYCVGDAANTAGADAGTNAANDGNADIRMTAKGDLDGDGANQWFSSTDEDPTITADYSADDF
ncbi:MAG: hypothetical protein AMJ45_02605 [Syntrophobacter sp. DG_60]|nr:MAG: hypothetical protein AMJ45_02605 [Syntrophobacter sp. DG_60]